MKWPSERKQKTSWKLKGREKNKNKGREKNKNNSVPVWNLGTPKLWLREGDITAPQEQHNRTREGREKGRGADQESAAVMYWERLKWLRLFHLQGRRLRKYDQGSWNIKAGAEMNMKLLFGRLEGRYTHRDWSGTTNCPKRGPFSTAGNSCLELPTTDCRKGNSQQAQKETSLTG